MKARWIGAIPGNVPEKPKAFIGISLSNDVSAIVRRLPSICAWAETNTQEFTFLIGDSLHKHNEIAFENGTPSSAQLKISAKTRQICEALDRLKAERPDDRSFVIILASELAREPSFEMKSRSFRVEYERRDDFRGCINEAVRSYLERRGVNARPGEAAWMHSVSYQVEELAIFEMLVERGFRALVYPGPQLPAMKAIVSGRLPGVSGELEKLSLVELRIFEG